ncbi:hypothetical protein GCM10010402_52570 [Actinomadura luteofluorescens]|uniref:DUF6243 family protein n=1 Tax=Actinomadura luteofluorescens TaxID=46163 RepID=UPI0021647784|nr:DUF6243 family protein [Actinomadura glauciflava]MCR3744357.1 hypothetical protein [Actinomadura glauciflava]
MSKSRGRNGMLGVGGQRKNLSRGELRGGKARAADGDAAKAAEKKKDLLRKMRERTEQRTSDTDE